LQYKENIVEVSLKEKIITQRKYENDFEIPYKSLEFKLKFLNHKYIIYSIGCTEKIKNINEINSFAEEDGGLFIAGRGRICPLNNYFITYSKINNENGSNKRKRNNGKNDEYMVIIK